MKLRRSNLIAAIALAIFCTGFHVERAHAAEPASNMNYIGINDGNYGDSQDAPFFADMIRTYRTMAKATGSTSNDDCPRDANGWPTADLFMFLEDGAFIHDGNGTYAIRFTGQATIAAGGGTVQNQVYDSPSNTTTANIVCSVTSGINNLTLTNTKLTSTSATNTGVANIQLMRPSAPGSATPFAFGTLFTSQIIAEYQHFQVARLRNYSEVDGTPYANWTDRVPAYYASWEDYPQGQSGSGNWPKGFSIEGAIALCNASNCDYYVNIPALATDDYITKIALAIKYGTDGNNPYTSTQASPVWAPLNSNLKVYIEYSNEIWNSSWPFNVNQSNNYNLAQTEAAAGGPIAYDGLPGSSTAAGPNTWASRHVGDRTVNISNLFRNVFGDSAMPGTSSNPRIRPVLEWQYGNGSGTGTTPLLFVDNYYNNVDGSHVATPHPVSYYIWGGGTAAYYGPVDPTSTTLTEAQILSESSVSTRSSQWDYMLEDIKWTSNYGIKRVAYEGGLSFGDDNFDSDSTAAKQATVADPAVQNVEITNQDIWSNYGGDLLVYFESSGNLAFGFSNNQFDTNTQKLQGMSQILGRTKAAVTVGTLLPATLTPGVSAASWFTGGGNQTMTSSPNHAWTMWAPLRTNADATYTFTPTVNSTGTGSLQLWVDGVLMGTFSVPNTGGANQSLTGLTATLTAAKLHGCRVIMTAGSCNLVQLAVSNGGAIPPGPPSGLTASAGNTQVTLNWSASIGATSYVVKRSTTSGSGYATVSSPTTTSYTNTGLTNGTLYYFVVDAVNTAGTSGDSSVVSATPNSQTSFNGQATFTSTAPTIDGTVDSVWSSATQYNIANHNTGRTTDTGNFKMLWDNNNLYVLATVNDSTLIKDATVWNGDTIELFIDADNSKGASYDNDDFQYAFQWNSSVITESKHNATAGVVLAQTNITGGYRMEIKIPWGILGHTPSSNSLMGADVMVDDCQTAGARAGKIAWFATADNTWNNPSLMGTLQLAGGGTAPAAPTGLTATAGNAQASLSWTASSGATSYNVLRSTVSGSGYTTVTTGVATTSYTNTGLTNGTTYYFVVDAVNASGTSGNSSQASATPASSGSVNAVNELNGSPSGWSSFTYSGGQSQTAAGLTYSGLTTAGNALQATGSTLSTSVGILPSVQSSGVVYTSYLVNTGTLGTNDSTFLWFYNGATEQFRAGTVFWSSPVHAFGFFDAASNTQAWSSTAPASNTAYLLVVKTDFTNGVLKMYVNPTLPGSEPGTASVSLSVPASQLAFDRVEAAFENNTTARIDEIRVGTTWASITPGSAPAAPTGLTAIAGNTQIALSWTASSGATSYNVLRSTTSGSGYASVTTGVATTSYTNTGLTNGTTYYFVVDAVNASGTSGHSNQASATPVNTSIAKNEINGSPSGWSSFTYSPSHSQTATGLTYTGLPTLGNALQATAITSTTSDGVLSAVRNSGVVYTSFLVNPGTFGTNDSAFLWFFNGATEQFRAGTVPWSTPARAFGFFAAPSGTSAWSSTVPTANTTYLLVVKIDYTAGTAKLFINPSPIGTEPGTANATLTVAASQLAFDRVKVMMENNTTSRMDEIRIGTTWASVTQ